MVVAARREGTLLLVFLVLAFVAAASTFHSGGSSRGSDDNADVSSLLRDTRRALVPLFAGKGDGAHKPFWPMDQHDVMTIALATLGLIVAAGGGIGGGGILVPLYILVLGFSPRRAIPLSNVTILGGSIANVISGCLNRHPCADRPLLDFSLILMMEPTTIVGAVVGSFANKVLPELVISILLVIVLTLLARRTLKKGFAALDKEGGIASLCASPSIACRMSSEGEDEEEDEGEGEGSGSDDSAILLSPAEPRKPEGLNAHASIPTHSTSLLGRGDGKREGKEQRRCYSSTDLLKSPAQRPRIRRRFPGSDEDDVPLEILSTRSPSFARSASFIMHRNEPGALRRALTLPIKMEEGREEEEEGGEETLSRVGQERVHTNSEQNGPGRLKSNGKALSSIIETERSIPAWKPALLTLCFSGIVVIDVLKGGEGSPSPLSFTCGSLGYWLVTLSAIPWVGIFFIYIRHLILQEHQRKVDARYSFLKGDIHWTPSSTIKFPFICITAGLFAGIFGVGGGIVKGKSRMRPKT
ncbi:hypothetical protein VYU27_009901 [Nannochloropsis oceanica]